MCLEDKVDQIVTGVPSNICTDCASNSKCAECNDTMTTFGGLNEMRQWICAVCWNKESPHRLDDCCKACHDTQLTTNDNFGLCASCYDNKAKFSATCTLCTKKFITRDLDLFECEQCSRTTGKCVNCNSHFDKINPDSRFCELCRIKEGCIVCSNKKKPGSSYCSPCTFRIENRVCTQCFRALLFVETTDIYGECSKCSGYRPERSKRGLCVWCYKKPSTSDKDYFCDECRIKVNLLDNQKYSL